ncbi:hypothetical protein L1887_59442 [Cichorium endivia]|nr:hypothetical protein L1887_59442 [Cichorium endivia]
MEPFLLVASVLVSAGYKTAGGAGSMRSPVAADVRGDARGAAGRRLQVHKAARGEAKRKGRRTAGRCEFQRAQLGAHLKRGHLAILRHFSRPPPDCHFTRCLAALSTPLRAREQSGFIGTAYSLPNVRHAKRYIDGPIK